jgi:hypothetical protein
MKPKEPTEGILKQYKNTKKKGKKVPHTKSPYGGNLNVLQSKVIEA